LIVALAVMCLAGQSITASAAATSPTVDKAALNKAVQEAIAKAKAEKSTGAAGAGAGGSVGAGANSSEAFSNLTGKGGEEETAKTTTAATTTTTSPSSWISTAVLVPIFIAGALLLGGIAFFIVRDARSIAPAGDGLGGGSSSDQAARLRKRRAKAKAARRQRKRNR
jgi:hypothetical protein